jgi:hypothetical protein
MSGYPPLFLRIEVGTWLGGASPQGGDPTGGRLPSPRARVTTTTCTSLTWLEPTTVQGRNGLDSKAV